MGEVWRARDTRLDRDVAIKILPEALAADPERIARFEREAKTLAALNHQNIAHIHGFEESGGVRALVMELVDGPTLADRIAQGPIPLHEALHIARQIAEAVEAAHDHGIIHRDLKPANIKVRDDGTVKVLDFGLAKAMEPVAIGGDVSQSPTITSPAMTRMGIILGTAAYMSPEQAKGRPADKRSDIWAFGCVLYEMLTRKRAFGADDMSDTLAAVLRGDPDWAALPPVIPASIRTMLRRCLIRDPKLRLRDIGEARIVIDAYPGRSGGRSRERTRGSSRQEADAAAAQCHIRLERRRDLPHRWCRPWRCGPRSYPRAEAPLCTLFCADASRTIWQSRCVESWISPDGRLLAFVDVVNGIFHLWVRPLDSLEARVLPGTEDGVTPFWSADSRSIGFFDLTSRKLKKVDVSGGPPETVCDARVGGAAGAGGTWNLQNVILFGQADGLFRVSAAGGVPTPVTTLDPSRQETAHSFPQFLPDGRHFLFLASSGQPENSAIYVGSLDSKDRTRVISADLKAEYVSSGSRGHLLFVRDRTLTTQPFDADTFRLTGDPSRVLETVDSSSFGFSAGLAAFSLSKTGVLAYRSGVSSSNSRLVWFD